jgi:maltokinase
MTKSFALPPNHARPIVDSLAAVLPGRLEEYLPRQRWYADKQRTVARISLADTTVVRIGTDYLTLAIVELLFADGHRSRYFIPLASDQHAPEEGEPICHVGVDGRPLALRDAVDSPGFHRWLLESVSQEAVLPGADSSLLCRSMTPGARPEDAFPSRATRFEQSNSTILYGRSLIAKVYRRLSVGTNPDIEIGAFLTQQPDFQETPSLFGWLEYQGPLGNESLAMVQEQLRDPVDCWSYVLDDLRTANPDAWSIGARLGALTGRMHAALAADSDSAAVRPEPITHLHTETWRASVETSLARVLEELPSRMESLDAESRELAEAVLRMASQLRTRATAFEHLLGLPAIRVHGDYHLGQVLRTPDERLYIVDFEGEPQRPIEERARKTSPLKDVAGMLRSFSYARGAATAVGGASSPSDLIDWERSQHKAFVEAYVEEVTGADPRLLPAHRGELDAAIAAWQIDKALYEVLYELSSRPDWLWLPLAGLAKLI